MKYAMLEHAGSGTLVHKIRQTVGHLSAVAAILGASVMGFATPAVIRAQEAGRPELGMTGTGEPSTSVDIDASSINAGISDEGYADLAHAYEPRVYLDYLAEIQASMTNASAGPMRSSSYPSAQVSPHEASLADGHMKHTYVNPNSSGAEYLPYVYSLVPDGRGVTLEEGVADAASELPVDVWASIYDDRQPQIERQMHRPAGQPSVAIDLYRYVYADSQVSIEQQAFESKATELVATSDGWFVSQEEATLMNPPAQQSAPAPMAINAPATPIASVDLMRNVYVNGQASEQTSLATQSQPQAQMAIDPVDQLRYVYENGHVTANVLNGVLLANGRSPVTERPRFAIQAKVAGGIIGEEVFLY